MAYYLKTYAPGSEKLHQCCNGSVLWSSNTIHLNIKLRLFTAIVLHAAIYVCAMCKNTSVVAHRLDVFHSRCIYAQSSASKCGVLRQMKMRHGAIPRRCYNNHKSNDWPHPPTAERNVRPYTVMYRVPEEDIGPTMVWVAEEDMAEYLPGRPGVDVWQGASWITYWYVLLTC